MTLIYVNNAYIISVMFTYQKLVTIKNETIFFSNYDDFLKFVVYNNQRREQ